MKVFDIQCWIEEQKVSWMHLICKAQPFPETVKGWKASIQFECLEMSSKSVCLFCIYPQNEFCPFHISSNFLLENLWSGMLNGKTKFHPQCDFYQVLWGEICHHNQFKDTFWDCTLQVRAILWKMQYKILALRSSVNLFSVFSLLGVEICVLLERVTKWNKWK